VGRETCSAKTDKPTRSDRFYEIVAAFNNRRRDFLTHNLILLGFYNERLIKITVDSEDFPFFKHLSRYA
jgi:hypothetical protein